ncbi:FAD-dependent monooxygenase [Streptomyces sp. B1866]|uniref:FAD-dependent monooxygenase n=1 Tax=Streptomyces sp. B1866 TaxID=3075431 RepID=UPI00288E3E1B|nr:FAD-dependent monooxygenase [Streptomyces sp. B1866]MDT3396936.1 FAD-dependent monooxygenase [Streptomyces sp. B1866]
MSQRTDVLIVGAGPNGLAAACELRRLGVGVRIVDADAEPHKGTRAIQLWPPTDDVLRETGVFDEAQRRGRRMPTLTYHLPGGRELNIALGARNEPLLLPQDQTVELLEASLERHGVRVERSTRVVGVSAAADGVSVKTQTADGPEVVSADWLIGADGAYSTVRGQLGIDFPGKPVPTTFLLAEGDVDGELKRNVVHYFLGRTGPVVFAPMPDGTARLSAAVTPDTPLTEETVQRLLDERGPGGLTVRRLRHITTFGADERIAAELRQGRCFLVGDAAHTHSPLGGQGLNLGLQDVRNLSWKLAGVIHGRLRPEILDTYEPERRAAAEQIVRTTHQLIKMFMLGPAAARVRNTAWRSLDATGALRRWFVPLMAGWRVSYPGPLWGTAPARTGLDALRARLLPAPGTRTPHWAPEPDPAADRFRLLTLGPVGGELPRRARELAERRPGHLVHEHAARRVAGGGFLLLRPDGYIAVNGVSPAELVQVADLLDALTAPEEAPLP